MKREMEFVFVGVQTKYSKKDNKPFNIIKLADAEEYESLEFFLATTDGVNELKFGDPCIAVIDISKIGWDIKIRVESVRAA